LTRHSPGEAFDAFSVPVFRTLFATPTIWLAQDLETERTGFPMPSAPDVPMKVPALPEETTALRLRIRDEEIGTTAGKLEIMTTDMKMTRDEAIASIVIEKMTMPGTREEAKRPGMTMTGIALVGMMTGTDTPPVDMKKTGREIREENGNEMEEIETREIVG
jgi:hypothetical protein